MTDHANSLCEHLVGFLQVFDGLPHHVQKKADQATKASKQPVDESLIHHYKPSPGVM